MDSSARPLAAPSAPRARGGPRFVVGFAVLALLFELLFFGVIAKSALYARYLELNVRGAALVLRLCGVEATSDGLTLATDAGAILVQLGCDALEATGLFLIAVLLFPAPALRKLWGALAGTALLTLLNLARLASLVLLQPHSAKAFRIVHLAVWPAALILAAVVAWIVWARGARRPA
jgi:exosortase/archaeosortase family protein